MWYGGWQTDADFPHDKIYYRVSADNVNWSEPITVLRPGDVASNAQHVNDPTVTLHYNSVSAQWQYTMYYTLCVTPCNQPNNQIWSAVSPDGITWLNHQVLLAGPVGPAEPSAVIDPEADGTFWKIYYVDRLDAGNVKMVKVNGNRNATSAQIVYAYGTPQSISGPEVRYFNGKWQLFFNAFFGNPLTRVDIYKIESTVNSSWPSGYEQVIIQNTGPTFCATSTPGVLPAGGAAYDLYFALTPRSLDGNCDLTQQQSIQRWRMLDD